MVRDEIDTLAITPSLDALLAGLQGLVNSPGDAASQQQLSDARTALQQLATAPSNIWPSSDRQLCEELGIDDLLGDQLLERIEGVLTRNEMTPAVAVAELTPMIEQVKNLHAQLNAMAAAFAHFGLGADEPRGDAEIVLTIPRDAVHEDLKELGDEFKELWLILAPFQELVTGSRSGIPVESISSSAFGLELLAVPAFAYGVARAVNEILSVYKNVLEIREARQRLKESGVPDGALAGVDDFANQAIATRNAELARELVDELPVASTIDEGRRNELVIDINLSLNALANRIDKGYDIDVRAPEPPPEPEDHADDEGPDLSEEGQRLEFQRQIRAISPSLRADRPIGASILALPEGPRADGDEDPTADGSAAPGGEDTDGESANDKKGDDVAK